MIIFGNKTLIVIAVAIVACSSGQPATSIPVPQPAPGQRGPNDVLIQTRRVDVTGSFSPRSDQASIDAYVPDIAPFDSGGECNVLRTGGNGATIVSAQYPDRLHARTSVTMTFDSAGHMVRFNERHSDRANEAYRGCAEQLDSALQAHTRVTRSSTVQLDFVLDQGLALSSGAGKPTIAISAPVRVIERLARLGPPTERMARSRKLCGV